MRKWYLQIVMLISGYYYNRNIPKVKFRRAKISCIVAFFPLSYVVELRYELMII